jgi:hypothetical protein
MSDEIKQKVKGRIAGALKSADSNDAVAEELHEEKADDLADAYAEDMAARMSVDQREAYLAEDSEESEE